MDTIRTARTRGLSARLLLWTAFAVALLTGMVGLALAPSAAYAEGSADLTANGGYRPYLERYGASTAGQNRLTEISVYLREGETLCFGTSVKAATASYTNQKMGTSLPDDELAALNQVDVLVLTPGYDATSNPHAYPYCNGTRDSSVQLFNVDNDAAIGAKAQGYVSTRAMEQAGPDLSADGSGAGYVPFSITAAEDGVYKLWYFSGSRATTNPTLLPVDSEDAFSSGQKGSTVAAWDATVYGKDGAEQRGRAFTDELFLNMGSNKAGASVLMAQVYPVTNDGYQYKVDFNGMDPFGFVFFANNRGLLSNVGTAESPQYQQLYHSAKSNNNQLSDLSAHGIVLNNAPTEDTDQTYHVFFNEPSDAALEGLGIPTDPATENGAISDLTFTGNAVMGLAPLPSATGAGYVGGGGTFTFTTPAGTSATSYEIQLNFGGAGTADNVITLANTLAAPGKANTVVWDGKDAKGAAVPAGTYGAAQVSVKLKGGEIHFPLMDVETSVNGLKVTRLNGQGTDAEKRTVYYNNSADSAGQVGDGWTVAKNWVEADRKNASATGADSQGGVMSYGTRLGDQTVLDVWAHYSTEATPTDFSFKLVGLTSVSVEKKWYAAGAESLPEVQAQLCYEGAGGAAVPLGDPVPLTEDAPSCTWEGLPADRTWSVQEVAVPDGYQGTATQTAPGTWLLENVLAHTKVTVSKEWADGEIPGSGQLQVTLYQNGSVYAGDGAQKTLTASEGWTATWEDLPAYDMNKHPCTYTVKESVPNGWTQTRVTTSGTTADGFAVAFTNARTQDALTITKHWGTPCTLPAGTHLFVQLLDADGTALGDAQELSGSGSWTAAWRTLPAGAAYAYEFVAEDAQGRGSVPLANLGYRLDNHATADLGGKEVQAVALGSGDVQSLEMDNLALAPATVTLAAQKAITPGDGVPNLAAMRGQFTYTLACDPATPNAPLPATGTTVTHDASGAITFGTIKLTEPGTYRYTITEGALPTGWSSEGSSIAVKVEVTATEDGRGLRASATYNEGASEPATITNTLGTTTVTADKEWKGIPDGFTGTVPDATFTLYQNGASYGGKKTVAGGEAGSVSWEGLPLYHQDGDAWVPYTYTVEEAPLYGYTTESSVDTSDPAAIRYTFVNTFENVSSLTVTKHWDNGSDSAPPAALTVQLMDGDTPVGDPVELNADDHWTHTWSGIAPGSQYRVQEVVPANYTGDAHNGDVAETEFVDIEGNSIAVYSKDLTNAYTPKEPDTPTDPKDPDTPATPEDTKPKDPGAGLDKPSSLAATGDVRTPAAACLLALTAVAAASAAAFALRARRNG